MILEEDNIIYKNIVRKGSLRRINNMTQDEVYDLRMEIATALNLKWATGNWSQFTPTLLNKKLTKNETISCLEILSIPYNSNKFLLINRDDVKIKDVEKVSYVLDGKFYDRNFCEVFIEFTMSLDFKTFNLMINDYIDKVEANG